ncbi:MAG: hypothetical protein HOV77_19960 [Hamadaea sp.]|uniref:hypothetical protein n=1 Tax=Hamadaea sp. TaxID=2024425 RepID=UPI00181CB1E7|nr:hypothetical protein [Hamadaea sp.]NUR79634.1 hypothetical protein [Dermatophilaceae bacterium]NUT21457.1 hypothetical protein [Hamadaea sp.]
MTKTSAETEATQALRAMFAAQAQEVSLVQDLSGVTVRRARKLARRRTAIGTLAATVAFVLSVVGIGIWQQWNAPVDETQAALSGRVEFGADDHQVPITTGTAPLMVDLVVGSKLYDATSGTWRDLGSGVDPGSIVRTPAGWLVGGSTTLGLQRADGTRLKLLDAVDGWASSADGSEVAVVRGETLQLDKLTRDGLQPVATGAIAAGWRPIGFLATAVLLAKADRSRYAIWYRDGTFDEVAGLLQVYPSYQSDTFAVVNGSVGRPCLVRVSVSSGRLQRQDAAGCHEFLEQGAAHAVVSPNGQNLATPFDGGLWVINLARSISAVNANGAAAPVWIAACASDADATPVWQDDATVVTTFHGELVACGVDGTQRTVAVPDSVPAGRRLVRIER